MRLGRRLGTAGAMLLAATLAAAAPAHAQTDSSASAPDAVPVEPEASSAEVAAEQRFALHVQGTFVVQNNRPFHAAISGDNSLDLGGDTRETADLSLYAGVSPWRGAELWVNPEIDQGFGLANTLGAAGFPSGEAYKVGKADPYFRLQRLFVRQSIGLGGEREDAKGDLNQLGGKQDARRMVLTIGKFSVGDIFDTNTYAHDPRADFLNWTVIDAGAFDYAADAWGYSTGGAAELYLAKLAIRAGLFNLSRVPNSTSLEPWFRQYELVGEIEEHHRIVGRDGKLKVTVYVNHGRMAQLDEAVAAAAGGTPDPASVRRFAARAGAALNLEQSLSDDLGLFARASLADGRYEAFEFTDVDRSLSGGVSLAGKGWQRDEDKFGLALVVNHASPERRRYLAAGGLGILVGDGALPHPADERIVESYYDLAIRKAVHLTGDVQLLVDPAYNGDRGPVVVLGLRLHAQY